MKRTVLITLLALAPLAALAGKDKAKVITSNERPANCIAAIEIYQIDGEEVLVNPKVVELDPGEHSLKGRALNVDTTFCKALGASTRFEIPPLVHEFEAGKTYWVGLDHSAANRRDWRIVVYQEDPAEG